VIRLLNKNWLRRFRALYASGNFDDVQASRDQDVLLFKVVERPVIATMTITGNKLIPTDSLTKGLKGGGISEGEVLKRSSLQVVKNELEQQYAQQGRYDAEVKIESPTAHREAETAKAHRG